MIKATRINNTIVCIIEDKMYNKAFDDTDALLAVYEVLANTDENNPEEIKAVKEMFAPTLTAKEAERKKQLDEAVEDKEQQQELLDWMEDIKTLGDEHFEVDGIKLFMKGINITVPEFLAREFAIRRKVAGDFKSLMNFWRLCALNTDARCREDLYKFLINNKMAVTPSGYFVAYRNVNVKDEGVNRKLDEFVAQEYSRLKRWKKSPKNYCVVETDTGYKTVKKSRLEEEDIGTVKELYKGIAADEGQTIYTDAHSGSTRIVLGQTVAIDRNACDADPEQTCSRGLHAANSDWLKSGYYGSVGLAVLINPMHVVAVPYTDGGKLRCCEYLPICTIDFDDNGKVIPFDTATFEFEYAEHTVDQLEVMCATARFESLKEHEIIPKEIDIQSLKNILEDTVISRDEMNKAIHSKVVSI
jgi:hypothetical protein